MPNQDPYIAQELLSHQTFLRRLAVDLVGEDADDLVQDVWQRALERPPQHGRRLRGWLARVARNLAANRWRDEARRTEREEERTSARPTGEELEARFELRKELVQALDSLSQPCRETILLRYFEGLAPRDIARRRGTPVATVKTRLRRGLAQLREALDKRYGGDRATWMSAVTALGAPGSTGVVTGTLVTGWMAMGTMTKVSAVVLVAAAGVYFVARTQQAHSPRMAATEPPGADVELAGPAVASTAVAPATEAVRRIPVAEERPADVPASAETNVLRVVLDGITEENARMTRVTLTGVDERDEWPPEIRDSWPCQGLTSEFDLDPFFASVAERHEDLRLDELEIQVDHPLHLIEGIRVPLSRGVEESDGRTVFEVRVRLTPAAVILGRLVRADGTPAAEGLVGALRLEGDFPIDADGRAVECAANGAFELRVPASGRYALASYEEGLRPTTTRMEALLGTAVDVGTIVLEPGHPITGHALRQGKPLAGATVSATPPTWKTAAAPEALENGMRTSVYEGRTFATPARSVHLLWLPPSFSTEPVTGSRLDGRFELAGLLAKVDENGAFAFRGLGSGEYLLRMRELAEGQDSVPGYWDDTGGEEMYRVHGDRPALVVRAPAHGVELEFRWTSIRFELAGDLESEDVGRLLLKSRAADPTPPEIRALKQKGLDFTPEFFSTDFALSGYEPTFVLQAPPDKHLSGEVEFPGRQPAPFELWTPEPGGEVVVPIRLARAEELATLVIELENPEAELPETFSVMLWRAGQDDLPPDERLVETRKGQLRVEDVFPGEYRVRVRPGKDAYSQGLFHHDEFDLELPAGRTVTRSIMMQQGAGLRFTVRGENGALLSGEYELHDHLGDLVDLNTYVRAKGDRWASSWEIYPYGTHESFSELHPGRYQLVLRSQGYAERRVTVELRAGEYEDVDVTLSH